jgi:hypothetical protein
MGAPAVRSPSRSSRPTRSRTPSASAGGQTMSRTIGTLPRRLCSPMPRAPCSRGMPWVLCSLKLSGVRCAVPPTGPTTRRWRSRRARGRAAADTRENRRRVRALVAEIDACAPRGARGRGASVHRRGRACERARAAARGARGSTACSAREQRRSLRLSGGIQYLDSVRGALSRLPASRRLRARSYWQWVRSAIAGSWDRRRPSHGR